MGKSGYPAFSVVMAVYKNDRAEWLQQAIDSLLNQSVKADDIVIVVDGPLTEALNAVLRRYKNEKTISIMRLPENKGLGNALNIGIAHAKRELVARMDADDIAVENRFELQLAEFDKNPDLDILGGQIAEFIDTPDNIVAYRKVPTSYNDIKQFARRRSPFNHPTVMYKKSTIQKLGGYDVSAIRIEDYDLWLRAIHGGATVSNLSEVVLDYRANEDAMRRRKTFSSLKNHTKARLKFYKRDYISAGDLVYGVITQTILLILPVSLAKSIFNRTVRYEK